MDPLKSPGLDGFGTVFYQKHWRTFDPDVCEVVLSIFNGEGMIPSINITFIALIPKKNNADTVSDFHGGS